MLPVIVKVVGWWEDRREERRIDGVVEDDILFAVFGFCFCLCLLRMCEDGARWESGGQ